ncbi:NADH:ubiquinone oxidoreductase subunit 5 (subunit L)/multisubunit Na+/H+ antiporter MnhA subunit [Dyadobacter sp. BE34]|uniref:NADH:ubiquinone oxidoreductase subunit 5 (Subunit L)/multisubunit Na+/H+ antiporter MnhA subunit n=1 Tax=Dyadobacter fermentans TaxID=94254 RepID=A0ABU1QT61_9BACT|nr:MULTISPECIES: proton-conducting transporter membrane subunit [Dyadobacter]MDR6804197.1 NADH:ubiquinone oxidoreductase subunit 5 (subunit L)/multisubunit Na+/H+ antiporter MnhA subunit [Dyadobacter fermentans]MDR7041937.1 NADH:ubiquinone oxidoreductase subunit 5 (subunit L)/multisubunit Na+/H+ antiporter MnhA subunit [Dyadobacter sp. BE242]MDR7196340.1 NADH:ubiquinone oxidoreductase subunit 5 (subunit L)/multisubunit Na+/H+ antiporter MnhA subunit [Dyadobacter sp. BE34]MDR7213115.1 NADH:ubiqu
MFWSDFHFDGLTLAYLTIGLAMTTLAVWNGRKTLRGHKQWPRFIIAVLLFCAGYGLAILSGGLKTLLLGWEVMGVASFLLIILHRDFKNGGDPTLGIPAKAFFIYRLGDVGLLLAMWASHHLGRENAAVVSLLVLVTASMQSSQLPFSSWLPQALQNSTTAGAILLATLTVQMGVFLLLRSYPFWEHQLSIRVLIGLLGLTAAAMAAGFARVQSSVKRRVAYVSMAHTGLIFIEVAAGFKSLALIHVAANAFLGAYRLLVPPALVSADTGKSVHLNKRTWEDRLPKKLKYTIYMFFTKEWGLYARLSKYLRP